MCACVCARVLAAIQDTRTPVVREHGARGEVYLWKVMCCKHGPLPQTNHHRDEGK